MILNVYCTSGVFIHGIYEHNMNSIVLIALVIRYYVERYYESIFTLLKIKLIL